MNLLKESIVDQLQKSKKHLDYSFNKVKSMNIPTVEKEEELEVLESFSSRFSRYSDLIISKYFRLLIKERDPAFNGSVIDLLNIAEKVGWIDSTGIWRRIRELRNIAAHEYSLEDYRSFYVEIFKLTASLLKVRHDL